MGLSEREQQVLAQLEKQLREESPSLAQNMGKTGRGVNGRALLIVAAAVIIGIILLVSGVATARLWLGVVGFIAMLSGVIFGLTPAGSVKKKPASQTKKTGGFMERQQKRWDERRDH